MARVCSNCGHGLQEGDKFCAKCGTAIDSSVPHTPDAGWEYCEIDIVDAGDRFLVGSTYMWTATAVGRRGMYEVARSERLNGWPRGSRVGIGRELAPPTGRELENYQRDLQAFVQRLVSEGWQPTQERGQYWYSYKFQRQPNAAASSELAHQPLTPALLAQWRQVSIRQGPTAAVAMIDRYVATAPQDSDDYIGALLEQLYLFYQELRSREDAMSTFSTLDDALGRRLEAEPRNVKLLEYRVRLYHQMRLADDERQSRRQLDLVRQGLPLNSDEYEAHMTSLSHGEGIARPFGEGSSYAIFTYDAERMAYVNKCLAAPIDAITRIQALIDKSSLVLELGHEKGGRAQDKAFRERGRLRQEARAICDRELAKHEPKPGQRTTVESAKMYRILEAMRDML